MEDRFGRSPLFALGFMCGTSLDGIDGSLISLEKGQIRLLAFEESPFPLEFRTELRQWMSGQDPLGDPSRFMPDLANLLSQAEIRLARVLLSRAKISQDQLTAVGTHGVTLRHHPVPHSLNFLSGTPEVGGVSYQFADPFPLSRALGVPIVSQFRGTDIAAGGCGAPLAPILHRAVFTGSEDRAYLNIGGIANLTFLPAIGSSNPVMAFDTGPGNMLLDLAVLTLTDGEENFDADGLRAKEGRVLSPVLEELLTDPYFARIPPKSTGREEWGETRLADLLKWLQLRGIDPRARINDLLATLVELTAEGIRKSLSFLPTPPRHIIAGGGGIRNPTLMARIESLTKIPFQDAKDYGFPPQSIESAAFAYLSLLTLSGRAGAISTVTGASEATVLGQITPAPGGLDLAWLQDVSKRADIHLPSPDRPRTPA